MLLDLKTWKGASYRSYIIVIDHVFMFSNNLLFVVVKAGFKKTKKYMSLNDNNVQNITEQLNNRKVRKSSVNNNKKRKETMKTENRGRPNKTQKTN